MKRIKNHEQVMNFKSESNDMTKTIIHFCSVEEKKVIYVSVCSV